MHALPYGKHERKGAALLFVEGESAVASSLFFLNDVRQVPGRLRASVDAGIEFIYRHPRLRDVR